MIYCPHRRLLEAWIGDETAAAFDRSARLPCPYEGCHADGGIAGPRLNVAEYLPLPWAPAGGPASRAVMSRRVYRRMQVPGSEHWLWCDQGTNDLTLASALFRKVKP